MRVLALLPPEILWGSLECGLGLCSVTQMHCCLHRSDTLLSKPASGGRCVALRSAPGSSLPSPSGQTPDSLPEWWPPGMCFLAETYLRNLEEKLTQNKLILKEELRTLLHLCESRDDMELAKNVIYRWGIFLESCHPLSLPEQAHPPPVPSTLVTSKPRVQMPALSSAHSYSFT